MSTPTNHWKLGLFVLLGVVGSFGAFIFLGGRALKKETVAYVTYFDESVQGLEVGSPVKFRGVSIGNVSDIALAGDRRHVAVTYALGVTVLNTLGLTVEKARGEKTKLFIPQDLRVQLASAGITGVKFMQLDFFEPATNPPLELPFAVAENSIPAVPSTMKNLEDSVVQAVVRFPEVANQLVTVLTQVNAIFAQVEKGGLPARVAQTLALIDKVLAQVDGALVALDPQALSRDARSTMSNLNLAVGNLNQVLARVNGEKGLASSLLHTSDALGNAAQNARHVGPALEDALKDVQGAAQSVQRLADSLENDPDMLIKGRAKRVSR
jgi:phospholipid/cholesterol/gamma-HCH transport system substrate-binding protein